MDLISSLFASALSAFTGQPGLRPVPQGYPPAIPSCFIRADHTLSQVCMPNQPGLAPKQAEYEEQQAEERKREEDAREADEYFHRPHVAGETIGLPGLRGALVCPDYDTYNYALHLMFQVKKGQLYQHLFGADTAKQAYAEARLTYDDVILHTGCFVVPTGQPVEVGQNRLLGGAYIVVHWAGREGITPKFQVQ